MKRLFFALWPDDETRDMVVRLNRTVADDGLRKVKADNVHATLVFLGGVDSAQEQTLKDQAGMVTAVPFTIEFDRLTLWRQPGILSLTTSHQPQALLDLVAALSDIAAACDVDVDRRPYKAHVTLARKARVKPAHEFAPLTWQASEFALVESVAGADGVHYRVLKSWPLNTEE